MKTITSQNFNNIKKASFIATSDYVGEAGEKEKLLFQIAALLKRAGSKLADSSYPILPELSRDIRSLGGEILKVSRQSLIESGVIEWHQIYGMEDEMPSPSEHESPYDLKWKDGGLTTAQSLLLEDYPELPKNIQEVDQLRLGMVISRSVGNFLDELDEKINILNAKLHKIHLKEIAWIRNEQYKPSNPWKRILDDLSDKIHTMVNKAAQKKQELFNIWQEYDRVGRTRKLQREVNRRHY